MADCRSLVEFLRAFERRRRAAASSDCSRSRRVPSTSSSSRRRLFASLCDHSPMAALDALALLAVLAALAFLVAPYARLLALELGELVRHHPEEPYSYAPFAAGAGAAMAAVAGLLAWEAAGHRARRCGKPRCRGMRKAVEFDIQLETEECVRGQLLPAAALLTAAGAARPVELGDAHRELEAELRKMAPPNGRTVLIFRSPCGCPKGRMEVWGAKKVRRIKKFSGPKFCFPRVSCACSRTACRYFPWASIRSCRCRCTCQFNFRYLEVAFQMIQGESWNAHEPHDCFWSSFWVMNMNVSSAGFCTSRR